MKHPQVPGGNGFEKLRPKGSLPFENRQSLIYKEASFDPESRPSFPPGAVPIAAPGCGPPGRSRRAPEKAILSRFRPWFSRPVPREGGGCCPGYGRGNPNWDNSEAGRNPPSPIFMTRASGSVVDTRTVASLAPLRALVAVTAGTCVRAGLQAGEPGL